MVTATLPAHSNKTHFVGQLARGPGFYTNSFNKFHYWHFLSFIHINIVVLKENIVVCYNKSAHKKLNYM